MKPIVIALSLLLIASTAESVELSGYYENTLIPEYSEKSSGIILDASKLRLDLQAGGEDNELEFRGNLNFIAWHSGLEVDFAPYLPEWAADSLTEREIQTTLSLPASRVFLDNAFLTWRTSGIRLRMGRQQLSWGSAYSFNPTDLFHRKDLLDPTYEKEGVSAVRLDYGWGIGGQASGIFVPQSSFERSGYALRLGTHVKEIGYDVALTLHHVSDSTALDSDSLNPILQKRNALGLDFSGGLLGLGVWFEGNYNLMEWEDDFFLGAVGTNYTLAGGLYVMAEYLYDGRKQKATPYPLDDWLEGIYFAEPIGMQRLLVGCNLGMPGLVSGSGYLYFGLDGSWAVSPRVTWMLAQNADLTVYGAATFGDEEGQFPPGLYNLTARVKVYF